MNFTSPCLQEVASGTASRREQVRGILRQFSAFFFPCEKSGKSRGGDLESPNRAGITSLGGGRGGEGGGGEKRKLGITTEVKQRTKSRINAMPSIYMYINIQASCDKSCDIAITPCEK